MNEFVMRKDKSNLLKKYMSSFEFLVKRYEIDKKETSPNSDFQIFKHEN